MRRTLLAAGVIASLVVVGSPPAQSQTESKKQTKPAAEQKKAAAKSEAAKAAPDNTADEVEIRANVAAFAKAYNGHDAKAVAELFAPSARIVTEEDEVVEGREAIGQVFEGVFADDPQTHIEVTISSIKFIGADLALEVGSTKTTPAPGETPDYARYTVLHFKRNGKWLMELARDTEGEPPTNHDRLQPLESLIGDWVDESPDAVVMTSYRWTDDKQFILGEFKVQIAGRPAMSGTQRIGWDPLARQIRSWVFDTEGGFGEGLWTRDGDTWIVKMTGVRSDGKVASATNSFTRVSKDRIAFESRDRVVGGESMPDSGQIPIVRQPPKPGK
jgi:uncharacterized protein (TIGR02246 family)